MLGWSTETLLAPPRPPIPQPKADASLARSPLSVSLPHSSRAVVGALLALRPLL